jgi:hypothetical protein
MPLANKLVALSFMLAVAAVYVLAAALGLHGLHRRLIRKAPPPSRRFRWLRRAVFVLAAMGLCCLGYAHFVEPYWLEVDCVRVTTARMPKGTRPVRLVHISDLHSDARARLEDKLPRVVADLDPDVIVFTGDAVNCVEGLKHFKPCMAALAATAPTFAVRGNWDSWEFKPGGERFARTGVRELNGEAVKVRVNGAGIWIVGAAWGAEDTIPDLLKSLPDASPVILLCHSPDEILTVAAQRRADLYCAGHTHGGQVALPFYGALITFSRHGKRFESGLHKVGQTWLHVSRGIGMEGSICPRIRFCARPQVTLIEIAPAE